MPQVHRQDYEYYVTYLEHERRNDRWIPEICIRIDGDSVARELNRLDRLKLKEEEEAARFRFLENNVHQGMS